MKFIMGILNNECPKKVRFWDADGIDVHIGDYAVVENLNGYDLVEVIGYGDTDEDNVKYIVGENSVFKKTTLKKVRAPIIKEFITGE